MIFRNLFVLISQKDLNIFNKVIIGNHDRIFPANNQVNFWENKINYKTFDAPHFPFYKWNNWGEVLNAFD